MILNEREVDKADLVCLTAAMVVCNEKPDLVPEGDVMRVPVPELGDFGLAAELALEYIVTMHRESPDDWDGLVWYELLSLADKDSLADRLVEHLTTWDLKAEDIRQIVVVWLKEIGI